MPTRDQYAKMSDSELAQMESRRDISNEDWSGLMEEMKRRADRRPAPAGRAAISTSPAALSPGRPTSQAVVITDIAMPFGSMVVFMVKWSIATIPALIILSLIGGLLIALLAVIGIAGRS